MDKEALLFAAKELEWADSRAGLICIANRAAELRAQAQATPEPVAHKWDRTGERCVVCGDKDWMGGSCTPQNQEQHHAKSEAESQALPPEGSDAGVAPRQTSVVPDVEQLVKRLDSLVTQNLVSPIAPKPNIFTECRDALTAQQEQLAQKLKDVVGLTGLLAKEKRRTEEQQGRIKELEDRLTLDWANREVAHRNKRIAELETREQRAAELLEKIKRAIDLSSKDTESDNFYCEVDKAFGKEIAKHLEGRKP